MIMIRLLLYGTIVFKWVKDLVFNLKKAYLKLQSLVYGFSPLNFLVPPLLFPQNARKAISVFSAAAAAI